MSPRTARLLLVLGAFVAGLVLFSAVIFIVTGRSPAPIAMPSAVGGPFQLVDQNAKPITDQDMKGQPFLVFFGFTHCPDVCPTTLFEVSEIFRALGPDAEHVRALFVTVDPERDTPAVLKDYLSSFDPRIIGVTGDEAAIAAVEKAYRVYAKKVPTRRRRLHHGPHRDRLSDEQGRPLRRAVQHEAAPGGSGGGSEALSLSSDERRREVRASPCSVFSQR